MTELWTQLLEASRELVVVSAGFFLLGLIVKGEAFMGWIKQSWGEARLNLFYYFLDVILILPIAVLLMGAINDVMIGGHFSIFTPESYADWPITMTILFCVFASDFIGYWRHRLLHTSPLWPVHSVHHSDTEMTWTTLARFHPINRLITMSFNTIFLTILGIPIGVIALNGVFRHYYGYYVHANLPWSYGPLRFLFVSPTMHRWHHVREVEGSGSNFTTVFSIIDVVFGTFYMPKREVPRLGIVERPYPDTWVGQMLYPFKVWASRLTARLG